MHTPIPALRLNIRFLFSTCVLVLTSLQAHTQRPAEQPDAARILHHMQQLEVLGSALYIAAHPDDENTRLIAYLANDLKVRAGYLSLTRGDGGQNLIGAELGDALGIIRTQELMEARRIDGGEQFFTRAVDFGYSKSAEESLAKWGHQEILSDVVRVIRKFRPDVIITRFPPDGNGGHGHHTASALLAKEAFDLAGDPKAFPEQLAEGLQVWKPKRLFWNGSTWWDPELETNAKKDPIWVSVDVGGYDPLLGLSYTEIAGRSRSMHKSQGFGAAETRGSKLEFLKSIKGDPAVDNDIFYGIDLSWSRILGADLVSQLVSRMVRSYDMQRPDRSTGALVELHKALSALPQSDWRDLNLQRTEDLLIAVTGTVVEIDMPDALLSDPISLNGMLLALDRSPSPVRLTALPKELVIMDSTTALPLELNNTPAEISLRYLASNGAEGPFWLQQPHGDLHVIDDKSMVGRPVNVGRTVPVELTIEDVRFTRHVPLMHRWVDRVDGERIRACVIGPVASIEPARDVMMIPNGSIKVPIKVAVRSLTDSLNGRMKVVPPAGWGTTKDLKVVAGLQKGEVQEFTFDLMPGPDATAGQVAFELVTDEETADQQMLVIDHPHILPQVYYTPAMVQLELLDIKVDARTVGYVKGAGDDIPQAMQQLGITVDMIDPAAAKLKELSKYDAIVIGIRAYNTVEAMNVFDPILKQYVEQGGTVVVQYNTASRDMMVDPGKIGPYPFAITRDRVTVEEAQPTFLSMEHPLLNIPNKITVADFSGWVQERGLYFLGDLDPHYTPLIAWNDPGEEPLNGALVTCDFGKGRFIYTGISFFRQLPAGVPGAYRLWANLLSRRAVKE